MFDFWPVLNHTNKTYSDRSDMYPRLRPFLTPNVPSIRTRFQLLSLIINFSFYWYCSSSRVCLSCELVQVASNVIARFCVSFSTLRTRPKQAREYLRITELMKRRFFKMAGRLQMAGGRQSLCPNGTASPPTQRAEWSAWTSIQNTSQVRDDLISYQIWPNNHTPSS